jgi:lysophospholipase L1-like esterase
VPARRRIAVLAAAVLAFGGVGVGTVMAASGAPQPAPAAPPASAPTAAARAEPVHPPGESGTAEVRRWVEQDRAEAPPADSVLFIGSSSIRRWESLSRDFAEYDVVQRGWGGSVMQQILAESPWLVRPLAPKAIVLRTGLNDLRSGRTAEQLLTDVRSFVAQAREGRADTQVLVLAIAPTPSTLDAGGGIEQARREANRLLAAEAAVDPAVHYVDTATPFELLAASDRAAFDRLSIDGIHLTPTGYAAWVEVLRPALAAVLDPVRPTRPDVQGLRAGDRLLLDLGPDDGAAGVATVIDASGLHWNDWWPTRAGGHVVAGEHRSGLVAVDGRVTGVSMTVTGGFRANAVGEAGLLDPRPDLLGDLAVPSATRDSWVSTADDLQGGDDDLPGGFALAGLDTELRYRLTFLGSAAGTAPVVTEYAVHGEQRRAAQLRASGARGADRDDGVVAVVDDVVPDARGRIWVDVTLLSGSATRLEAVELSAAESPER